MARLAYDFGIAFDRDISFDAELGPALPPVELDAEPEGDTVPRLVSDGDIVLEIVTS